MPRHIRDYLEIRVATPLGFAHDDSRLLVASNLPGTMQLYEHRDGQLRQLTQFAEPVSGAYLTDRPEILLALDEGGNERHQLHRLSEDGTDRQPLVVDPAFIHRAGGLSRDGTLLAFSSNRRNGVDFDIYVHDLRSGEDRLVFSPGGWCDACGFSPNGHWLGVQRLTELPGDNDLYILDLATDEATHVSSHEDEAEFGAPAWLPDSSAFFFSTNTGRDFAAIARYDLAARTWEYVCERDWDLSVGIDWPGRSLLLVANENGYSRAEILDPVTLERRADLALPGRGVAANFAFSHDGSRLAYFFTSPVEPGDVWMNTLDTGAPERLTSSPGSVPAATLVEPEVHAFRSFDGEMIPLFLYLRPSLESPGVPVVCVIHGGPEGQSVASFNPIIQYLVDHGYAVAVPNVRGSSGYGKRFLHLDDVRKRLDSVRDLEALHGWLEQDSRLDANRAALYGGSYGGYMVLAGLVFQPHLWALGVDIVGISSLVTFLQNTSEWRRAFREREYGSLGDDMDFLIEASPITHIDHLQAPLLIIHGANDPRVPLSEAEQIHQVLQQKGLRSELLVYPDEGHGLQKLPNRIDAYTRMAEFLNEVLRAGT